jgi:imidazole glycerol phosphate synthase subunit HisF
MPPGPSGEVEGVGRAEVPKIIPVDIAIGFEAADGTETAVDIGSGLEIVEEFVKVLATEVTKVRKALSVGGDVRVVYDVRKVLLVGGDVRAVYDGLVAGPVTVGYMVITELSTP